MESRTFHTVVNNNTIYFILYFESNKKKGSLVNSAYCATECAIFSPI